jgi:hypothetical protein
LDTDATTADGRRRLNFVERALLLRISFPRAEFLAACAHDQAAKNEENRNEVIPYDPAVQIHEALRLGLGLKDTAEMMGMTIADVAAHGLPFPARTRFPKPPNATRYNLFTPDPINPNVCAR